jgi:putative acetyltransferase
MKIRRDDLQGPEIRALLEEHLAHMRAMLAHMLHHARAQRVQRLWLETGSTDHFLPARSLYAAHGFVPCGPFADYREDPHSTFMRLDLQA